MTHYHKPLPTLADLTLPERVGQMLAAGFEGLEAPEYLLNWLAEGRLGGVILFSRNVESPEQVARLTDSLHRAAKYPLFISIDQEGGLVARLREGFTEFPGAMALGAADSEALAERVTRAMADEMRALGVNLDYAPVVDLTHDINNPSVGIRSLGAHTDAVGRLAAAQIRGFQSGGVAACAKHFPGIGRSPVDTHVGLAVVDGNVEDILKHDLEPFRQAVEAGVATVMISHVLFTELDSEYPSTLSPVIVHKLLRERLGFAGMTASDCMEMRAVSDGFPPEDIAVLAALAGIDAILFSHTPAKQEAAYHALIAAAESGRVPEAVINQAVERILAAKAEYAITESPDISAIRHPEHLAIAREAARAGLVLVRDGEGLFPLDPSQKIALIEFAPIQESEVVERGDYTGFVSIMRREFPDIQSLSLLSRNVTPETLERAKRLAEESDVLILATRSAHLVPSQLEIAQVLQDARRVILLCLRNPYDAGVLTEADAVLCTLGDSVPSLEAAVDALLGRVTPSGKMPVSVA